MTRINYSNELQIAGSHQQKFEVLANAFKHNFIAQGETGAGLCVYHRGEKVVDLYGSYDSPNGVWHAHDRVCTMSSCKGPLALCVHLLAQKRLLTLDDRVVQHWPEFGKNGKANITIRHVLNHTAGLPIIKNCKAGDIFNWHAMVEALEQASQLYPEGSKLAYHALTYGHLVGEIIRRVDGRMPAEFFQQEISERFGIEYDLRYFNQHSIRPILETFHSKPLPLWIFSTLLPLIPCWKMQFFKPCNRQYQPNSEAWQMSEIPAVSGQGTARGLAKLYAFLANNGQLKGVSLCSSETCQQLQQISMNEIELSTGKIWRMGLGFMINSADFVSFGPSQLSFGHMGMGGSIGFADPENQLSFAYITEKYHQPNRKDQSLAGNRLTSLIEACFQCLN